MHTDTAIMDQHMAKLQALLDQTFPEEAAAAADETWERLTMDLQDALQAAQRRDPAVVRDYLRAATLELDSLPGQSR